MIGNDKIHAIFRTLVEEIASGKYIVGQRLPTDKELAKTFNTSRINVFRALEQLKQLGIISSRKRAGTVVIAMPNAELIQQLLNDSSKVVYCWISSNPQNIHWNNETLDVLKKYLDKENFQLHCLTLPNQREKFSQIIFETMRLGASGLIIFPDSDDSEFLDINSDLLVDISTPIIMLNRGNDISRLDFVSSVNIDVMGDAIRFGVILRKNGFKKMIISGANYYSPACKWCNTRITGLQLGFRSNDVCELEIPDPICDEIKYCLQKAVTSTDLIIVAIHPLFAEKILVEAEKQNLHPGKDFNLVSFDDNPLYEKCQLTTTYVNKKALGNIIGELFFNIRRNPNNFIWDSIRVASSIVQRTSCRSLTLFR
jgi:DNA-binding LacI/PurR family transcriptional regulator